MATVVKCVYAKPKRSHYVAMFFTGLVCGLCGKWHSGELLQTVCQDCGRPLLAQYDLSAASAALHKEKLDAREPCLWRYREMLPLSLDREPINARRRLDPFASCASLVLDAIRASSGTAVSVADEEIFEIIPEVGAAEGIFFSPEGAACCAALEKLKASGWIRPEETIVIFNTAAGAKNIEGLADFGSVEFASLTGSQNSKNG
jgi:threonine synthase